MRKTALVDLNIETNCTCRQQHFLKMNSNNRDKMWQRKMNPNRSVQHTGGRMVVNVHQGRHEHISELNQTPNTKVAHGSVLDKEISRLRKELEYTKDQLQRQIKMKEMFINEQKETRQELDTLRKYSNPETLEAARTATLVLENIRSKNKRDLQNDFEELKVAFITNEGHYELALQAERKKNEALQNELERLRVSADKVNPSSEPEATTVREEVAILQQQLKEEVEKKNELQNCYEELKEAQRLSQDKFTAELLEEREKSKNLQEGCQNNDQV